MFSSVIISHIDMGFHNSLINLLVYNIVISFFTCSEHKSVAISTIHSTAPHKVLLDHIRL